jgi:3D (Asp-Asp-Asp) domain-containing protein
MMQISFKRLSFTLSWILFASCGGGFSTTEQNSQTLELGPSETSLNVHFDETFRQEPGLRRKSFKIQDSFNEPISSEFGLDSDLLEGNFKDETDLSKDKIKKTEFECLPENKPDSKGHPYITSSSKKDSESTEKSGIRGDLNQLPKLVAQNIQSQGSVTPSVYFFPSFNEDKNSCSTTSRVSLVSPKGDVLDRVCPRTYSECNMQGKCSVTRSGKTRIYNVHSARGGITRFFEATHSSCRYGYGVQSSCLDPFYSLAADLRFYKPGDVVYVPGVTGAPLPDGSKHSGFFVVRDRGRAIKGRGRFDFYSGSIHWQDPRNPFTKLGLADKRTRIPYFKITGDIAKKVREQRGFPSLPRTFIQ